MLKVTTFSNVVFQNNLMKVPPNALYAKQMRNPVSVSFHL